MNIFITSNKFDKKIYALNTHIKSLRAELEREQAAERALAREAQKRAVPGFLACSRGLGAKWVEIAKLQHSLKLLEDQKNNLEESFTSTLAAALKRVNRTAVRHTINPARLIAVAQENERELVSSGIRVKNRAGTQVVYRPPGKSSQYFQIGRHITTSIVMRRARDGWRLISAQRDYCYVNQREFKEVTLRPAAYKDAVRHATRNFRVWDEHAGESEA